jgi:tetratricopeptide (TPR) repeat protein/S1-C subfamily serine protease
MKILLLTALILTTALIPPAYSNPKPSTTKLAQADFDEGILTPQQVQATAKNISVRITSATNAGSGVIVAKKGSTYLILTNAHVIKRATNIEIQAPDGQKYAATAIDGGFDTKYDLALLQFTSNTKYSLANLSSVAGSAIETERTIYSAGFPFDSKDIRITSGEVSQLSDIPFDNGTQIGYTTNKGQKGIRQGMSGGAIFDAQGNLLGINTISVAPILPNYTYHDGSKPIPTLATKYTRANWGVPVYNFLTNVKADILYGYENLPKLERQVTPSGYMAKLNSQARQMTVRIENSSGNGSGVIVGKQGNTYYVLTAKHVFQNPDTNQKYTDNQIITYDQDRRGATSTVVAEGVDLAIVKFDSNNNYPIAQLGEYSQNQNDIVFAGGFPGRSKIESPLWQWQLNPGGIEDSEQGKLQAENKQSFSNGYDLIYSNITYGGMSGGPVFDTAGNVIGIHGRAESTNLNSLGISIKTFTGLLDKLRVDSKLLKILKTNPVELNPADRQNIVARMENIPQPQEDDNGERWLAYGNQLFRTRQYDKSIVAFDRAIAKNQTLSGNYGKALSLDSIGKYQLAEGAISQAVDVVPSNQRIQYYYLWKMKSAILRRLEKHDDALKAIDIAILLQKSSTKETQQDDLTLLNEKAVILNDKKEYQAAIAIYDESIRAYPEAYAYYNRGTTKSTLGNKQGAIVDFDRAIELNPKLTQAYFNRGAAKSELRNNQGAIIDYDRAIELNPKYAEAYYNRGTARSELGDKQRAIIDYDRAIALNPKLTQAYSNRAIAKSALGTNQGAMVDYDRAIALNPNFAQAYYDRGNAKYGIGDKQGAIIDFNRAIELNPQYPEAYYNRGIATSGLGNNQGAMVDFDRAIALNPNFAQAYYSRGNAKYKLVNNQGAIADYDRAIELNPQYPEAYMSRGVAKSALGNNQGAIVDYDRATELNPQYPEAYMNRGAAKSALRNTQGAIVDYDRAIELNPKYTLAYFNRGAAKSALRNNQGAVVDYDRVIELNSKFAIAYMNRGVAKSALGNNQGAIVDISQAAELFRTQEQIENYQKAMSMLELLKKQEQPR